MKILTISFDASKQYPTGISWCSSLMSCVSREHSCPYTAQKFKIGIDQWLNNEPARWVGPIPMDKVGRLTFEAFVNQIDIGWDQAFHGRTSSKTWNRATRVYHNERGLGEQPQPQLMGSQLEWRFVIKELWQIGTDCWIHQSEELYDKTEEEQLAKLMKGRWKDSCKIWKVPRKGSCWR